MRRGERESPLNDVRARVLDIRLSGWQRYSPRERARSLACTYARRRASLRAEHAFVCRVSGRRPQRSQLGALNRSGNFLTSCGSLLREEEESRDPGLNRVEPSSLRNACMHACMHVRHVIPKRAKARGEGSSEKGWTKEQKEARERHEDVASDVRHPRAIRRLRRLRRAAT